MLNTWVKKDKTLAQTRAPISRDMGARIAS